MTVLRVLKILGALATIVTGVVSIFWPLSVRSFTGLEVQGGRGVTEIRAVLGGLFLALGLAVLYFNNTTAYKMAGFGYLVVGGVRLVSMFVDRSVVQSNLVSLAFEIGFGIIFLI